MVNDCFVRRTPLEEMPLHNHSLPPNQQDKEQALGLILSYDIIKAHGGEISARSCGNVETKQGEGTRFILRLPLKDNQ